MFAQYVMNDELCGECGTLVDLCSRTMARAHTSEFEGWICRIALGGAGIKAKNIPKALLVKHSAYIDAKGDPVNMCHRSLWAIAKPLIGSISDAKSSKLEAAAAKASKPEAKAAKVAGADLKAKR